MGPAAACTLHRAGHGLQLPPVLLLYFLPVALLVYYALPRRGRHLALALLSYTFYGWDNPLFVVLLLPSTVVDYGCGLAIAASVRDAGGARRRRLAVAVSVVTNLSLLGFFKYFNFGIDTLNGGGAALGAEWLGLDTALRVTLPLGISFYTFQSMSYTIDVARGHAAPLRNFIDFACYVALFPQLVAGRIIRFAEIVDQLAQRTHTAAKFARGIAFVSLVPARLSAGRNRPKPLTTTSPSECQNHPRESSRTGRARARRPTASEPRRHRRGRLSAHGTQVDRPVPRRRARRPGRPQFAAASTASGHAGAHRRPHYGVAPPAPAGVQIARTVGVSPATVSRVLRRPGLHRLDALEPAPPVRRYEREHPGELLHLDVKKLARFEQPGRRVTGNRR